MQRLPVNVQEVGYDGEFSLFPSSQQARSGSLCGEPLRALLISENAGVRGECQLRRSALQRLEFLLVELAEDNLLLGLRKTTLLGELLVSTGEALELCLAPPATAGDPHHGARDFVVTFRGGC